MISSTNACFSGASAALSAVTILLVVVVVADVALVCGSSDFLPSSSSSSSGYFFRETVINTNTNTNSTSSYADIANQPSLFTSTSPTTAASPPSTTYGEEDVYVSTQALMCHGGDDGSCIVYSVNNDFVGPEMATAARTEQKYLNIQDFVKEEYDEDEDEDDDDDDDGHSSMLSTSSLRKSSRAFARSSASRVAVTSGGVTAKASTLTAEATARPSDHLSLFDDGVKQNQRWSIPALSNKRHLLKSSLQTNAMLSSLRGGDATAAAAGAAAAAAATPAAAAASSKLVKSLINSAIVTLVFEGCMGHIMEFLKIAMQTSPKGTTYSKVYKDITSEKGIAGLWDGFIPWGVIQSVLKGGVFGLAYAIAKSYLIPLAEQGHMPKKLAQTLAGGIAGGFQGFVLSPTLLMKTRVMTNEVFRESMSLFETTCKSLVIGGDIIRKEGVGSLMKGANTFAMKRVFDWSTRYYFADLFESIFVATKGSDLTLTEKSIASLLGGIASTVLTLPLDVLVAKTQDAKKAGVKVSPIKMFSDELKEEGWSGLKDNYMRGFEARLAHVCLTTVVMKTVAPIVYDVLFKEG
eukprot:CAMPEP_0113507832 /NCGR_PEP_ID=MMETSP0014_2-20120614/36680_1 /TAXON_ID=2857 /ORGANISM="Nitzschia sp." /LENGTH=576 /DNA_ID=CAMNT_0000403477 /DNA_START=181 /DNA_END=1911 /DNA_ORIENTATION=+ /assembly_acc=CAM_ASM_000159